MSPDKHFREVARGFLSDITDKARDDGGRINPARLGRETRKADPDAMRMLGRDEGKALSDIGAIGEKLLPEIGNSQTANRAMWLRLLNPMTVVGAAGGGGLGSGEGFDLGTVAGAGAGAVLAPKAIASAYLPPLMRNLLTKEAAAGPNAAARAISPEQEQALIQPMRAITAGGAVEASR